MSVMFGGKTRNKEFKQVKCLFFIYKFVVTNLQRKSQIIANAEGSIWGKNSLPLEGMVSDAG